MKGVPPQPPNAPVPRKLTNRWSGPHVVYNQPTKSPNTCYILHVGRKELLKTNVNRLLPWRPWDDTHLKSDAQTPENDDPITKVDLANHLEGDLMIIRSGNDGPFWVVKLLERRPTHPNGHLVQYFGNYDNKIADVYLPGWLESAKQAKSDIPRHYYRATPTAHNHKPFTSDSTNTTITDADVLDIEVTLTENNLLTEEVLNNISKLTAWKR